METQEKHRMKADIRRVWEYKGCKIIPMDSYFPGVLPIDFGNGICHNRYWRIKFPDGTWIYVENKRSACRYIDANIEGHQGKST